MEGRIVSVGEPSNAAPKATRDYRLGGINVGGVEGIPSLVYFWVYLLAVLL